MSMRKIRGPSWRSHFPLLLGDYSWRRVLGSPHPSDMDGARVVA